MRPLREGGGGRDRLILPFLTWVLVGNIIQRFAAVAGETHCTAWFDACAGAWLCSVWCRRRFSVAFSPGSLSSSTVLVSTLVLLYALRQVGCLCCVCGHVWLTATQARCRMPVACVSFRSLCMCPPCVPPCVSIFFLGPVPHALVVSCGCVSCSGSFIAAFRSSPQNSSPGHSQNRSRNSSVACVELPSLGGFI